MKARGDRFTMDHINPVASHTLQHGVWAASQYKHQTRYEKAIKYIKNIKEERKHATNTITIYIFSFKGILHRI